MNKQEIINKLNEMILNNNYSGEIILGLRTDSGEDIVHLDGNNYEVASLNGSVNAYVNYSFSQRIQQTQQRERAIDCIINEFSDEMIIKRARDSVPSIQKMHNDATKGQDISDEDRKEGLKAITNSYDTAIDHLISHEKKKKEKMIIEFNIKEDELKKPEVYN